MSVVSNMTTDGDVVGSDVGDIVQYVGAGHVLELDLDARTYDDLGQPEEISVTVSAK